MHILTWEISKNTYLYDFDLFWVIFEWAGVAKNLQIIEKNKVVIFWRDSDFFDTHQIVFTNLHLNAYLISEVYLVEKKSKKFRDLISWHS